MAMVNKYARENEHPLLCTLKSLNAGIKIGGGAYAQSRTGTQFKYGFRQSARAPSCIMTIEHLLLALLSNPSAREALEACSVDLVALRQELEAFIEQTTPVLPASEEERDTRRR